MYKYLLSSKLVMIAYLSVKYIDRACVCVWVCLFAICLFTFLHVCMCVCLSQFVCLIIWFWYKFVCVCVRVIMKVRYIFTLFVIVCFHFCVWLEKCCSYCSLCLQLVFFIYLFFFYFHESKLLTTFKQKLHLHCNIFFFVFF